MTGGFNHFNSVRGEFAHPLNGCWTQKIKEKCKKCLRLLSVTIFFHIIFFTAFLSKTTWCKNRITLEWSQIANSNTACPGTPYNLFTNVQYRILKYVIPNPGPESIRSLHSSFWILYILNIYGHVTPVEQFIQRSHLLPENPFSTTRVGIDTFFLHNTQPLCLRQLWYTIITIIIFTPLIRKNFGSKICLSHLII